MDRRFFLPVIIMFLSVLLLAGLMNFQSGSAQEAPDDTPAPVIGDKETVVQESPKATVQEPVEKSNTTKEAPESGAIMLFGGGGGTGGVKASSTTVVEEYIVVADFDYNASGLNVTFEDKSENASLWKWDFGDGNYSEEQNPIHEYTDAEKYNVTLIAYESNDAEGILNNASKTREIDLTVDDEKAGDSGDDTEGGDSNDDSSGKTPVTQEVPEFPTIAIPMAAIIGMAFIFSRKQ